MREDGAPSELLLFFPVGKGTAEGPFEGLVPEQATYLMPG